MSSNELPYDESNSLIEEQRSCVNQDKGLYKLHIRTHNHDDECYKDIHTSQSRGLGNYSLSNHFQCDASIPDTIDTATSNPAMFSKMELI